MKNRKILSLALAITMMASMSVSAFAAKPADPESTVKVIVSEDGNTGETPVQLTAEAALLDVTVPTALPVSVDNRGVVSVADGAKILNHSFGAVKVSGLAIAGTDPWATIAVDGADMGAKKVGTKEVALTINEHKTTGANTITEFDGTKFTVMAGIVKDGTPTECPITYAALVPAQATAVNGTEIAKVTFTVAWDA